jgi:hypothetical protein
MGFSNVLTFETEAKQRIEGVVHVASASIQNLENG